MTIQLDFSTRLADAVRRCRTPVMVGLDPRFDQLPECLRRGRDSEREADVADAYREFCRGILDAVAPLVGVVKPQAAFFEEVGPQGMTVLGDVIRDARQRGLLVVLDGKRNDIGTTAEAYARGYLGSRGSRGWGADALTVSPYLGDDSLTPFVTVAQQQGAGLFVLVKTSNAGGGMFQDLVAGGRKLYEHVADYVELLAERTAAPSNGYGCVGAVVGATYPQQLAELRQRLRHAWLLVPGYGAQGAAARDVAAAFDARGLGAIVNNSRGIIFASRRAEYKDRFSDRQWQDAAAAATRDMIDQLRADTPAGAL